MLSGALRRAQWARAAHTGRAAPYRSSVGSPCDSSDASWRDRSSDRAKVLQYRCADTLLLISVSDDEGDFGFVGPGDPIPRSGGNRHSEIISDKSDQADLTAKIAIRERRDFFVGSGNASAEGTDRRMTWG